jgi:hypothetical protein
MSAMNYAKLAEIRCFLAIFFTLVLAGFLVYALHTNKDQIALEIIKAIGFIAAGGMGGFAIGRYRSQPQKDIVADEEEP